MTFKFQETFCSQCGGAFGPGDHGYSHCDSHREMRLTDEDRDEFRAWMAAGMPSNPIFTPGESP